MKTIKTTYILFSLLAVAIIFSGCRKEGCTDPEAINYNSKAKKDDGSCEYADPELGEGTLSIMFDHRWGMNQAEFSMNTTFTHPGTSEEITFTTLNYYISNIKLQRPDGSWWKETESYHLIEVDENSTPSLIIANVPGGNYTAVQYMIGVDSLRNVSGAQTGALSPSKDMFWNWNTGYIFVKAEGDADVAENGIFRYHLGGFRNENQTNAIQIKTHAFLGEELEINNSKNIDIRLIVNAARFWHGGLSLTERPTIHMPGEAAVNMATNFGDGFILAEFSND